MPPNIFSRKIFFGGKQFWFKCSRRLPRNVQARCVRMTKVKGGKVNILNIHSKYASILFFLLLNFDDDKDSKFK